MSNDTNTLTSIPLPVIDITTSRSFPADSSVQQNAIDVAGRHFIVDFWGASHLDCCEILEQALTDAAVAAGAVLLHIHLHKFSEGGGVTGVALLAESHISVHTWPEREYAAFDVFMCGKSAPEKAVALLRERFAPHKVEIQEILRGKD